MEKNDLPFHFGTVVSGDLFYDREADARNLHDLVAGGQNVVLYAPRRYGKSSLVLKVAEDWKKDGFVCIYFDLMRVESLDEFLRAYADAALAAEGRTERGLRAILAAVGTTLIVRSILLNEHEVGPLLAFAFAAFAAGLYLFFKDIGSYRKKRQEHLRYKAGVRDYSPMSESAVASVLTARTPNTAYLTDQGLQELRAKSGPMGLL